MRRKPKFTKKAKNNLNSPKSNSYKLALYALGIIFLLLIFSAVLHFVWSLYQPLSPQLNTPKTYSWDGHSSINLVIKGKTTSVLNYDPSSKKIVLLHIPDDTYAQLPKNYGSWKVGSIYALGQEEIPPVGASLLKDSLVKLLGLPIDGYISLDDSLKDENIDKMIADWHSKPLAALTFIRHINSDLTALEAVKLFYSMSEVRSDKITSLDLAQSDITQSKLLPDSSRVLGVDAISLDLFIRSKMSDAQISQDATSVAIFNATSHPGLAQEVSRMVTNLGADSIIVSNTDNLADKTLIISKDNSPAFIRLAQALNPKCLNHSCSSSDSKATSSRAQITVVVGEDYFQKFH